MFLVQKSLSKRMLSEIKISLMLQSVAFISPLSLVSKIFTMLF